MNEITNYKELYNYMLNNINYGVAMWEGQTYTTAKFQVGKMYDKYLVQSHDQMHQSKHGLCYDQVEFERTILTSLGYKCVSYNVGSKYYVFFGCFHSVMTLELNENDLTKYILFEPSPPRGNEKFKKLHVFNSKEDMLKVITNDFLDAVELRGRVYKNQETMQEDLYLIEYNQLKPGTNYTAMVNTFSRLAETQNLLSTIPFQNQDIKQL